MTQNLGTQITSFFQAMVNRMVNRATTNNPPGSGHIGSESGNFGAGVLPIGSMAVYPDSNTKAYIRDGYTGNSTLYTIIGTIASKFAYIPRYVYEIKDPNAARQYKHFLKTIDSKDKKNGQRIKELFTKAYSESVVDNKLTVLLNRPNPTEGQDAFMERAASYYETAGEAIIWCNRGTDGEDLPNIDGEILEMWNMPPDLMEMVPDPLNVWGSLGWVFNCAGKRIPIDAENIIHIKKPNLNFDPITREHMRGLSPLRPGKKKITEDESATDASVALNQNGGAKGIAFDKTPGNITPTRETAMRNAVDRKVNGADMRGAVAWLQGDIGYADLSMSSTDMELEDRKDNIFDRLCNLFRIPPDLFKTGQTYQNILQARKDFITTKILPMCCLFRDEFNRVLLPAFNLNGKSYTYDIDATQIPELQDDMLQLVTALAAAFWMTPNERRQEMNQQPNDSDGADDMWLPNTLVKIEDAGMPMQQPGAEGDSFDPTMDTKPDKNDTEKDTGSSKK